VPRDPFELVIFDCDGVLVDSERICVRVDVEVLAEMGCAFSRDEVVELFVGSSTEVCRAILEEHLGRPVEDGWHRRYAHRYDEALLAELTAVDGVEVALDGLTVPCCVASNSGHETIRRNLRTTGLLARFADGRVFSATDVARGKPEPDLFLHAARTLGVDPSRCAVVEDSPYGVQAARAAGMRAFGYCGGLTRAERLEGPGTVVFADMRDLPALLAGAAAR
jgi:HAD superfamily hydrolase (TIGR01509 family)